MIRALVTIEHTATQYTMQHHEPDAIQVHCGYPFEELLEEHDGDLDLVTTYRDPYLVGASWGNRYYHYPHDAFLREYEGRWMAQWDSYADLLAMGPLIYHVDDFDKPKVKSKQDRLKLHRALFDSDLERYHDIIPEAWILHAYQKSIGARL